MQVRSGGELGEAFKSDVGVRQGCPLSPLLFGIYIDRLEKFMESQCPGAGTQVMEMCIRALFYADDIVLAAESPEQLQNMLGCLQQFCDANSMFVNLKKSEVVIFNSEFLAAAEPPQFTYNGGLLAVKKSYVYLGLKFEDGRPMRAAMGDMVAKACPCSFSAVLWM